MSIQDRPPNFRTEDGRLYLVRCFNCYAERGRENWAFSVACSECAWCGWTDAGEEGDGEDLSPEARREHDEFVKQVASEHGFPLSDWTPAS